MAPVTTNAPVDPVSTGSASALHMQVQWLSSILDGYRYRYGSELHLHESLARVLTDHGQPFVREQVLDAKNRADFFLPSGLVIEVKVHGSASSALRQVGRYIDLPQVTGVVLASTERWADKPLVQRPAWGGKPFGMVRLRRQSL